MGVGGQRHAPAALPPGKTRYPLYRRLGGPQGLLGQVQKVSLSLGFDPRTAQPVASRYTDCAIPAMIHVLFPNYWVVQWELEISVILLRKTVVSSFVAHHTQNWEFKFDTKEIKAVHRFGQNFLTPHNSIATHSFASASIDYVPRSTSFLNKLFNSCEKVFWGHDVCTISNINITLQ